MIKSILKIPQGETCFLICDFCGKEFRFKKCHAITCKNHFCSMECRSNWRKINFRGAKNPNWKGGTKRKNNYVIKWINNKLEYEHRLIMEKFIGRKLLKTECVHHKNGNPKDNRIENLILCSNQSEHMKIEYKKQ